MHQEGGKFTDIYGCKDLLTDPVTDERYDDTIGGCKHEVLILKIDECTSFNPIRTRKYQCK